MGGHNLPQGAVPSLGSEHHNVPRWSSVRAGPDTRQSCSPKSPHLRIPTNFHFISPPPNTHGLEPELLFTCWGQDFPFAGLKNLSANISNYLCIRIINLQKVTKLNLQNICSHQLESKQKMGQTIHRRLALPRPWPTLWDCSVLFCSSDSFMERNSHNTQFTLLKHTTQRLRVYSQRCADVSMVPLGACLSPQ